MLVGVRCEGVFSYHAFMQLGPLSFTKWSIAMYFKPGQEIFSLDLQFALKMNKATSNIQTLRALNSQGKGGIVK